jgi:PadR family transcriptional regulator PadR
MAKTPDDRRLDLLQGTLDMLILRTLQWGPQHGHGIGQAIRAQSDDLLRSTRHCTGSRNAAG